MNRNIKCKINNNIFLTYAETVWVSLKASNSYGANFDPYREVGYAETNTSPIAVKAIVSQIVGDSLIRREIGLQETGAIELLINEKDATLFYNAQKVTYNNDEYALYNKALGNKIQIYKRSLGFYKVILFKV